MLIMSKKVWAISRRTLYGLFCAMGFDEDGGLLVPKDGPEGKLKLK